MKSRRLVILLLAGVPALLLSSCMPSNPPATLYSLQLVNQPPVAQPHALPGMVLVMPVRVAPHLQSRSIQMQQHSGKTLAAASHLWTATLDKQIGQRITSELQTLLATDNIALFPGPRYGQFRLQVEVDIQEFSGDGHTFTTLATYTISDVRDKTIVLRKNFQQKRPVDKSGYTGYAETASQAVADLSREIAQALTTVHLPRQKG